MDSYHCLSRPNPTIISFDNSSTFKWTVTIAFLAEDDFFEVESLFLLLLACTPEATVVSCYSLEDDSCAVIGGDGWTIFNGLGCFILGVRFLVLIVILWVDEEESADNARRWRWF